MRNIAIYLTYDKDGIVDNYIGYMLKELKSCVDCLVVVCNNKELKRGKEILLQYADKIYFRDNIGYDVGGFKDTICNFLKWEFILEFEQMILVNDSFFGPFQSMKSIFSQMKKKRLDFWGLQKHGERKGGDQSNFDEYIQTYFLSINKRMLHSLEFQEYWNKMPYYNSFQAVVKNYEEKFTKYFADLGFCYGVLANTDINDSLNSSNNFSQYDTLSYELIKKRNFPFLKKQQMAYNSLSKQSQENYLHSMRYISENTKYNIDLIWENIIRTLNISDLYRNLHLNYIISDIYEKFEKKDIALIVFFAEYINSFEYIEEYFKRIKGVCHIIIIANEEEVAELYKKNNYNCIVGYQQDIYYYIAQQNYLYVCFIHDIDLSTDIRPNYIGKSELYGIWANLVKDANYIGKVINIFEKESHLGLLAPAPLALGEGIGALGKGWDGWYKDIKEIQVKFNLLCDINKDKPPIIKSNNFWIRGSILKSIVELNGIQYYDSLWIYLVQNFGFYSGTVENEDYASISQINFRYFLNEIAECYRSFGADFKNYDELKQLILLDKIKIYASRYSVLYIYGAGIRAQKLMIDQLEIEAFLISESPKEKMFVQEIPVMSIDDVELSGNVGIVVCVNEKNRREIEEKLKNRRFYNYLCI